MPNYIISAFMKFAFIGVVMLLWNDFVEPYLLPFQTLGQWFLNMSLYRALPYEVLSFVWDAMLVFVTFRVVLWIAFNNGDGDSVEPESGHTGFISRI